MRGEYYYGKACRRNNHHDYTGFNPRTDGGNCYACERKISPGLFNHNLQVAPPTVRGKDLKVLTPEQKAKHIESVIAWQKRNPDKVKGYIAKYHGRPEVKQHRKEQSHIRYMELTEAARNEQILKRREYNNEWSKTYYHTCTPEEKEKLRDRQRRYYKNKIDNMTEEEKTAYHKEMYRKWKERMEGKK